MRVTLPVDSGYFLSPDGALANSECTNLMPFTNMAPVGSSNSGLVSTPGLSRFGNTDIQGPSFKFLSELYVHDTVSGKLYKKDRSGVETLIGETGVLTQNVSFASNSKVLCLQFANGKGFFYSPVNGFSEITSSVYQDYQNEDGGILNVTSGDGYFIYCTRTTVFKSGLVTDVDEGTSFDALDFSTAEFSEDYNVAVKWLRGELHIFGQETIEVWGNVGGSGFPFQRIPGATYDKGAEDAGSIAEIDNSFIWVGSAKNELAGVYRALGGGSSQKISNSYIDSEIQDSVGGRAFVYSMGGHIFYGVNSDGTIFYDATESAIKGYPIWHKRAFKEDSQWFSGAYGCVSVYDKVIVDGNYVLSNSTFDNTISSSPGLGFPYETRSPTRIFSSPYLASVGDSIFLNKLELVCKGGVGINGEPSETKDPVVLLEVSDDYGRNWINMGEKPLGKQGQNKAYPEWRRLGLFDNTAIFRFSITSSVEVVFTNLVLEIEIGRQR